MDIKLQEADLRAIRKLAAFLPKKIFDAHVHLWHVKEDEDASRNYVHGQKDAYGFQDFLDLNQKIFSDTEIIGASIIVTPHQNMANRENKLRDDSVIALKNELDRFPNCVGEIIVLPDDTEEDIEKMIVHKNIRGMKCFHFFCDHKPSWDAEISEYLPESAWKVADRRGMCITLHLAKEECLASSSSVEYILKMAKAYPNATLVLSHCGRGFAAWTVMENAHRLKEVPNVYFDVSAICESPAIFACVRAVGVKRVLWGSDYPVSTMRGKCVSLADRFLWLYEEHIALIEGKPDSDINLIAVEELLAVAQACDMLELSREDIEDIFYKNAQRLFLKQI